MKREFGLIIPKGAKRITVVIDEDFDWKVRGPDEGEGCGDSEKRYGRREDALQAAMRCARSYAKRGEVACVSIGAWSEEGGWHWRKDLRCLGKRRSG